MTDLRGRDERIIDLLEELWMFNLAAVLQVSCVPMCVSQRLANPEVYTVPLVPRDCRPVKTLERLWVERSASHLFHVRSNVWVITTGQKAHET